MRSILLYWSFCSFLVAGMLSCASKSFYVSYVPDPTPVYQHKTDSLPSFIVPKGRHIITKGSKRLMWVKYGTKEGYIKDFKTFSRERYTKAELKKLYFNYDSSYTYGIIRARPLQVDRELYISKQVDSVKNSSNRSVSVPTQGGQVQVRGYYRKDGTYVRPHTRSAPRRR